MSHCIVSDTVDLRMCTYLYRLYAIKVQVILFYERLHMYKYDELSYDIANKSE